METQAYLTFELNDLQYGIDTAQVREIFQLPELTPIADAPGDIIGILNFRGKILPVMHLATRLGQDKLSCQLSDSVIVIECQGLQVGMVVNQVHDVQSFHTSSIEAAPTYEFRNYIHTSFAIGVAKTDEQLITLLNPEALIRQTNEVALMAWESKLDDSESDSAAYPSEQILESEEIPVLTNFFSLYSPNSTTEERQIFRQRAVSLKQSLEDNNADSLVPLAVIELGEEYFGVELHCIREFINIHHVMSIPCCPSHIVGNMNLRGEVMTLVDICNTLNLTQSNHSSKAVVIEIDNIIAGITVDQVLDVVYLPPSDISSMPVALPKRYQAFFQGAAHYAKKTLSILDLSTIFSQGGLVVEQTA